MTAAILGSITLAMPPLAPAGKAQTTCPVMGGPINKNIFVDYQGKRIYFCCPACVPEFNQNPGKYLQKLTDDGVTLPSVPKKPDGSQK